MAVDKAGNLFIADYQNSVVREVASSTGIITTIAGSGTAGYSGDGGPATRAELSNPQGVAVHSAGDVFVADGSFVIRRVDATSGVISTVAGNGTAGTEESVGDGGPATSAQLLYDRGVAVDQGGDLFIAATVVRRVDGSTGIISTLVGTSSSAYGGDGGPATMARAGAVTGLAVDPLGDVYFSDDGSNTIREVHAATGTVTTIAGMAHAPLAYGGDGGPATSAELFGPFGLALDTHNDLYIADLQNNRVRRVDLTTGIITTVAGDGSAGGGGDGGPATSAELDEPSEVAVDASGNLYIYDSLDGRVREVNAATE